MPTCVTLSVRCGFFLSALLSVSFGQNAPDFGGKEIVGRVGTNRFSTPVNQMLTPTGLQVELPGLRPQVLALSPDGKLLVTAGKTPELIVLAPASGKILQRVQLPAKNTNEAAPRSVSDQNLKPDAKGQVSFT